MPRAKKDVVSVPALPSTALALPSYVKADGKGVESIGMDDLTRPFLRIAQDKTPGLGTNGLTVGNFYNTTSGVVYGPKVVVHVICAAVGQMMWGEYSKDEGILCQAPDGFRALEPNGITANRKPTDNCGECVHKDWVDGKAPDCARQYRFLVLLPGETTPALVIMQGTSMPAARKLGSLLKMSDVNTWAHRIELGVKMENLPKGGSYGVFTIAKAEGWATEGDYQRCEALYNAMAKAFRGEKQTDASREVASANRGI